MQLYHKSLFVPLWLPITYLHLAVVQKACMLLLAMLLVVLQYYKMLIQSPVILVCLYLDLGQAGINYILLSMLPIC